MSNLRVLLKSYQPMFGLLDELGYLTTEQLHHLFFATQARPRRDWDPRHGRAIGARPGGTLRNTRFKLHTLQVHRLLSRLRFRAAGSSRSVWYRTPRPGLAQHDPGETTLRDDPVEQVRAAQRAWQRAELRRSVVGHPTLSCDQGPRARRYLREATGVQLADAQALPYDIIYRRKSDGRRRGYVYLVDDLAQPADVVLSWLPRPTLPKVQVAVLFRPGQDGSVYDPATRTWSFS